MGTVFRYSEITKFEELVYFTSVASIGQTAFRGSTVTYIWIPYANTIGIGGGANVSVFWDCTHMIAERFDAATTINPLHYNTSIQYTVITTSSVPALTTQFVSGKFYVLDSLVSSYQSADRWSSKTILPISQLPSDYPDCPWLDDLRNKGFIS